MATAKVQQKDTPIKKDVESNSGNSKVVFEGAVNLIKEVHVTTLQRGAWFLYISSSFQAKLMRVVLDRDTVKLECSPDPIKQINLKEIHDVRYGWNTDVFNSPKKQVVQLKEDRCFSIIYGPNRRTLNLQAKDPIVAQQWTKSLLFLLREMRERTSRSDSKSEWLKWQLKRDDLDRSSFLNFEECCELLSNLNVNLDKEKAEKLFQLSSTQFDKDDDVLDEFQQQCNIVSERAELTGLFQDCAAGDTSLSVENLTKFLREDQEMANVDVDYALTLTKKYAMPKAGRVKDKLALSEFHLMMNSPIFDILKEEHRQVNQDMDQPLNNYYISSSHNTYLVGDQLLGVSSIEGYISALERGCRCLELDLWDGANGQPIIYHGYTKTSKLLAKNVLAKGIKPYAFKFSPFPLILSVENHLSAPQQTTFAKDLREVFGAALCDSEVVNAMNSHFLSPNQLREKIIIKTTGAKVCCPILQKISNVCRSYPKIGKYNETENTLKVISLSELEALAFLKKLPQKDDSLINGAIIRVYPAATRMASGNFNPISFWNFGCQMVALNFQTTDKYLEINAGRFRRNGNCGYVLKPNWLLGRIQKPVLFDQNRTKKLLRLHIISGQNIRKQAHQTRKLSFYVSVQIQGHPLDAFKFKTRYVSGNGLNLFWNEKTEVKMCFPELAVIFFRVKYVDSFKIKQILGSYALPVESLAAGYRHVPLSSADLLPSIFVHVKMIDS